MHASPLLRSPGPVPAISTFELRQPSYVSDERWAKLSRSTKMTMSHAVAIEETDRGHEAEQKCERCAARGERCMMYKDEKYLST